MSTKLDAYMTLHELKTAWLAQFLGCDRTQAWRIRHGQSGTTIPKALKLEAQTGISWHEFVSDAEQAA